ncbi:MAG: phosphoadenylyl-sulfate reductase [Cyclobacteriaceae bacterium]|nr:phosphoadenylyl-sulfate reductase [Cyclobacteriaceae bacterium]
MNRLEQVSSSLAALDALQGLSWVAEKFVHPKFATSLGEEDQVLTQLIAIHKLPIPLFTLDTGRLFQETYELLELTQSNFGISIEVFFPERHEVEKYVNEKGINGFYLSVENRKDCCSIRKVNPLKRALAGADIWITGLRKSQSANRHLMQKVEWSEDMKVIKYNPLFDWSDEDLSNYINQHNIPVNPLHRKGFVSIGCAPCTRAIAANEDARAGRWWWEGTSKECGLHTTKIVHT